MNIKNITLVGVCCASLLTHQSSFANVNASGIDKNKVSDNRAEPIGFLYGATLMVNQEIYKGYSSRTNLIPIFGYKGEKLQVYGPFIRYDVAQFSHVKLSLQAAPNFNGFDESDSAFFEGMEERKFSISAGYGVHYKKNDWQVSFSNLFDVLNRSGGYTMNTSIGRTYRKGPVFFEPKLSVRYLDRDFADYYYGVRENEVNEFRSAYQVDSAVNTALGLSISTPIFFSGMTRFSVEHTWYDSSISDSPLVEKDTSLNVRMIFSKFF